MSKIKKLQTGYSGGIPLNVGDRYYGQDLSRDFWSGLDFLSTAMRGIVGQAPALLRGGICSKGTNFDDMDITAAFGIVGHQVTTPDNFSSLPPSIQSEDILALIVESEAQVNFDLAATATLDGVTTNYVKLRYKEVDGGSRNRAKKSGSYVYEVEPSFEIIVNTVSPTKYDILLCSFVGDGSSTLTITQSANIFETVLTNDDNKIPTSGAVYDAIELAKNAVWPVGSTYIQFPGDSTPTGLDLPGTWSNVSSELAGDFIRFEGGNALTFDSGRQAHALQQHQHLPAAGGAYFMIGTTNIGGTGVTAVQTFPNTGNVTGANSNANETRAVNRTVRKWRRIA